MTAIADPVPALPIVAPTSIMLIG